MTDLAIDIGTHAYQHVAPLVEGTVPIPGVRPRFHTATVVTDVFRRVIGGDFPIGELGWSFYLRTLDLDDPPFVALPVGLARQFRQSAIYVNTGAGIRSPHDLAGRTVGEMGMYGHDAGVAAKGALSDDYGLTPDQCRWLIGGFDWPMKPFDFVPQIVPDGVSVQRIPDDAALGPMLDAGEIDALISADVPACVREGSSNVAPLFEDHRAVERDYYRRTGIFPIMHTLVIRRDLAAAHPGLITDVYRAFRTAKDQVLDGYRTGRIFNHIDIPLPWLGDLQDEDRVTFGEDWWPYGAAAERRAIEAFLRWHWEQGLSRRRWGLADVIAPELLDT